MEAENTSEKIINFCPIKRRNNTEDSHLHARRRETLKYYNFCYGYWLCFLWDTN
jgi:hypothetical protein